MLVKRILNFFDSAGDTLNEIGVTILDGNGEELVVYSDAAGENVASNLSTNNGLLEFYIDDSQVFEPQLTDYNQAYSYSIGN